MKTVIVGGHPNYGFAVGIIMLETKFPRIPGDIGNATTFSFPVLYRIVRGASGRRVVIDRDPSLLEPFIEAGQELRREGVKMIATSCGFLAMFHRELCQALDVPVFTSSLVQIPLVYSVTGCRRVGVLTANAGSLTDLHFESVGASGIPLAVEGVEKDYLWTVFRDDLEELDVDRAEKDVVKAAKRLVSKHSDIGGIVLECTNLPPFARSVQQAVGLPVFDIVTLINMGYEAVSRRDYNGVL
jgi:Asp/Glu/hydantoin racemase